MKPTFGRFGNALVFSVAMWWTVSVSHSGHAGQQVLRFLVNSGNHDRTDCPISVALPEDVANLSERWALYERVEGRPVPCGHQILTRRQHVLVWVLNGSTPKNTIRTFEWRPALNDGEAASAKPDDIVSATDQGDTIEIRHRDRPVLTYRRAHVNPPEGIDPKYGRSGYIHPVMTPAGEIVSDAFPPDHPHQDGIFLAYTKTEFQGRQPNFWDLLGGGGFVRSGDVLESYSGPVCGGFRVQLEHVDQSLPSNETVALREEWEVRCWMFGGGENSWLFDITSRIQCGTDSPLVVKQYHYGGMSFRGARGWVGENVVLTTADGKTRDDGNHSRVPWVDLSGRTGDKMSGITIFTDPGNFRFPEPVRLHPTMPYFVYTPAVLGDWTIEPRHSHVSRYHYLVHDGEFRQADAERRWVDLSEPPRVAVRVAAD